MNPGNKIDRLLEWCDESGILVDGRVSIRADEHGGIAVFSEEEGIPAGETIVTISKASVLSTRSCVLSEFITPALAGPEAQLALSTALYTETWFGYIQSLPEAIDLPLCWKDWIEGIGCPSHFTPEDLKDAEEALGWLRGTEAEKVLLRADVQSGVTFDRLRSYFENVVFPLVDAHIPIYEARLDGFIRAYCLVSSRAFLVDAFHGLAMVPIADAFNHTQENHVHLESDYSVCSECGSLDECSHDQEGEDNAELVVPTTPVHVHDCYEMVTSAAVPPSSEIYNTYGETLSNAELLCQYGFVLEANDNDTLTWTMDEVLDVALVTSVPLRTAIAQQSADCLKEPDFDDTRCLIRNPDPKEHRKYIINADGQTSIQLWVLLLSVSAQKATMDLRPMLPSLYNIQTALENQCGGSDSDPDLDDTTAHDGDDDYSVLGALVRSIGDGCLGILKSTYQLLVELCQARKATIGKGDQGDDDLWDVLEAFGTSQWRTRSALLLAVNEKLIISSCEATWKDLLGVLEHSRASSRN